MTRPSRHAAAPTITKVCTRHYRDNGQTTVYVEWSDGSRTEAPALTSNPHMLALLDRAAALNLPHTFETW